MGGSLWPDVPQSRAVLPGSSAQDLPDALVAAGVVQRLGQVDGDAWHQHAVQVAGESRCLGGVAVVVEGSEHCAGWRDVLGGEQEIEVGELPGTAAAVEAGFRGEAVQRGRGEPGLAERDPLIRAVLGAVDAGQVLMGAQRGGQEPPTAPGRGRSSPVVVNRSASRQSILCRIVRSRIAGGRSR